MIAYLDGIFLEQWGNCCVLKTEGGVGYRVYLPAHTLTTLPEKGAPLALYVKYVVREDAEELFGFQTFEERQAFELLLSISKVGAKMALAILSLFRPADLQTIVVDDDPLVLTQVPGIGKKTAQHVFLELKDKLKGFVDTSVGSASQGGGALLRSVLDGLTNLGYPEAESYPIVRQILQDNPNCDVSEALRTALQALSRGNK